MLQGHEFARETLAPRTTLMAEFWSFLKDNKKWWLLPIIMVFMLVGALLVLGGTAAAPFIYTLF